MHRTWLKPTLSFSFLFVSAFTVGFLALRQQNPNAPSSASINPSAYHATISVITSDGINTSNSGNLNFNIEATPDGTMLARKQTVSVKTNATSGYRLYLSTDNSHANLTKPAGTPTGSAGGTIHATSGSHTSPAPLSSNSWGYAIASGSAYATNVHNFNSAYDLDLINSDLTGTSNTTKWAPLMPKSSPTLIQRTHSANNANGESLDIYYALKVNTGIPEGTYTGKIIYTAVIDATNNPNGSGHDGETSISPSRVDVNSSGITATIATSLKLLTSDNPSSTNYPANYLTSSDLNITIDGYTCSSPSLQPSASTLTATCTLPRISSGNKTVILSIPRLGKQYRTFIEYYEPNPYASGFSITGVSPDRIPQNTSQTIVISTDLHRNSGRPFSQSDISATVGGSTCDNINVKSYRPVRFTCTAPSKSAGSHTVRVSVSSPVNNSATSSIRYYNPDPYSSGFSITSVSPSEVLHNQSHTITISTNLYEDSDALIYPQNISATVGGSTCDNINVKSYRPVRFTCTAPSKSAGRYNVYVRVSGSVNKDDTEHNAIRYYDPTPPPPPTTISSITYMQDITPTICANSSEHQTATLIDRRDGQRYGVVKAKDDNCWMTKNLDLVLSTGTTLTSTYTDISGSWTPQNSTQTEADILWDTPNEANIARSYRAENGSNGYGVLYNWNAATAGIGNASFNTSGAEVSGSICPKGWRLPSGKGETMDKSFAKLYKAYNPSAFNNASSIVAYRSFLHHYVDGADSYFTDSPLGYVKSGTVGYPYAALHNVGVGYYHSSTFNAANATFVGPTFVFFIRSVFVANTSQNRRQSGNGGFAIRCVAR